MVLSRPEVVFLSTLGNSWLIIVTVHCATKTDAADKICVELACSVQVYCGVMQYSGKFIRCVLSMYWNNLNKRFLRMNKGVQIK